jgi:hypothetical protein
VTEINTAEAAIAIAPTDPLTTVRATVTLTVAPKLGQSLEDAAAEMFTLFEQYLTESENPFFTDYGTTAEELLKYQAGDTDTALPWGGYEGPFVLGTTVTAVTAVTPAPPDDVTEPAPSKFGTGAWYRDLADTYAKIAASSSYEMARSLNKAEAEKYYRLADRADRAGIALTEQVGVESTPGDAL